MIISETDEKPFLIISGQITSNKRKEFEQTFRLASSSLSRDCLKHALTIDAIQPDKYHFFSVWTSETAIREFIASPEYQLLNGAFHALGSVNHVFNGRLSEKK
jgi:quinol monooxygenase YgiN